MSTIHGETGQSATSRNGRTPTPGTPPAGGGNAARSKATTSSGAATPVPSGLPRLAGKGEEMSARARRAVGWYLTLFASVLLAHLLWAWSIASRQFAVSDRPGRVRVHWLGLPFSPTPQFSLLVIVALCAMLGSVAVCAQIFAHRAGYRTLEERWEWWYVVRPLSSAPIGLLFYLGITAGLTGNSDKSSSLAFAAAVGGLAGLFTERVVTAMRSVLGASAFNISPADPQEAKKAGGTDQGVVDESDAAVAAGTA